MLPHIRRPTKTATASLEYQVWNTVVFRIYIDRVWF